MLEPGVSETGSTGLGLASVHQRLTAAYGEGGIDMRCVGQLVPIAAHFRAVILAGDPENIRMLSGHHTLAREQGQ